MFLCLVLSLLVVGSQLLPAPERNRTKAYREAESLRQGVSGLRAEAKTQALLQQLLVVTRGSDESELLVPHV